MNSQPEIMKAKLYNLTDDSEWEDLGVGFPKIEKVNKDYKFVFYNDSSDKILYEHVIQDDDMTYDKTEDKVISYNSEKDNIDMALSFQNEAGARVIWDKIQEVRDIVMKNDFDEEENFTPDIDISIPTYNNLETVFNELQEMPADRKQNLSISLSQNQVYLKKFTDIFTRAEANQDKEKLESLCKIFKLLIQYAEHEVYEELFNDQNYLSIFGILEYDPEISAKPNQTHRQFLQKSAKYQKIVEFKDPRKLEQIHLNYRLNYLKDCVLGYYLDDRANSLIIMICQAISQELIKYIENSQEIIREITDKLRNMDIKALKFLHELFLSIRGIEQFNKETIEKFNEVSALEIMIEDIFQNLKGEKKVQYSLIQRKKQIKLNPKQLAEAQQYCFEILQMSLQYSQTCLQQYAIQQTQAFQQFPFLSFLVENITNNENTIKQQQCSDLIRGLIHNDPHTKSSYTKDVCLTIAEKFVEKLVVVFEPQRLSNTENCFNRLRFVLEIFIQLIKNYSIIEDQMEEEEYIKKLSLIIEKSSVVFNLRCKILISRTINIYKQLFQCHNDEIQKQLHPTSQHILTYLFKQKGRKQNLVFSEILDLISIAYHNNFKEQDQTHRQIEPSEYFECFEEDILAFNKHKNYNYFRYMLFQTIKNTTLDDKNNDIVRRSKKNSESYDSLSLYDTGTNHLKDIDNLPPVPSKIKNIQSTTSQDSSNSLNGKRSSSSSLGQLVNYEEEDDVEDQTAKKQQTDSFQSQ